MKRKFKHILNQPVRVDDLSFDEIEEDVALQTRIERFMSRHSPKLQDDM